MWERSGMVHLHWNCNNYNDDSNTRQEERVERVSTKHPAARGWELAISTNPELVCPCRVASVAHRWSFLGRVGLGCWVNTAEGVTGGVTGINLIIQQWIEMFRSDDYSRPSFMTFVLVSKVFTSSLRLVSVAVYHSVLNVKAVVGFFNQEKAQVIPKPYP